MDKEYSPNEKSPHRHSLTSLNRPLNRSKHIDFESMKTLELKEKRAAQTLSRGKKALKINVKACLKSRNSYCSFSTINASKTSEVTSPTKFTEISPLEEKNTGKKPPIVHKKFKLPKPRCVANYTNEISCHNDVSQPLPKVIKSKGKVGTLSVGFYLINFILQYRAMSRSKYSRSMPGTNKNARVVIKSVSPTKEVTKAEDTPIVSSSNKSLWTWKGKHGVIRTNK